MTRSCSADVNGYHSVTSNNVRYWQRRSADNSRHSIPKTLARAIRKLSQIKVSGKERQVLVGEDAVG